VQRLVCRAIDAVWSALCAAATRNPRSARPALGRLSQAELIEAAARAG